MNSGSSLVSVIVPAYNAAATISRTLLSITSQTHRALDIIIVDDGSRDMTLEIVSDHRRVDSRIRIIEQRNAGVAAARNAGIATAGGEVIAPVDADDLWRADKIERQLRALRAGGEEVGLVYSWSALIDGHDMIIGDGDRPYYTGDVAAGLSFGNFVGNGSTALMRRDLVAGLGGYDPGLRLQKAQGCEDWKLFAKIADVSHFAVVPDYLTGYRQAAAAMSGDVLQMLRSDAIVRAEIALRHPEHGPSVEAGRREYIGWMLRREIDAGHWSNVRRLIPHFKESTNSFRSRAYRSARLAARLALNSVRQRRSTAFRKFLPAAIFEQGI